MAALVNIDIYSDALVVLGTAGVVVPLVRRLGISPVLGYLGAGALLGPLGLGSFLQSVPGLYWFTIYEAKNVSGIAELGIVFLLFLIGLELSYERLMAMRRLVFGLGSLQIVLSAIVLSAIASLAGMKPVVAVIVGSCLALSSTAIVLDVLSAQGRLTTSAGRASFSILLAQDLAVIPILLFISIAGADSDGSILFSIGRALFHAGLALAVIVLFGRALLRPLFRLVATAHSPELFIAATLFVIVASGVAAAQAGVSMAIGAFVAGLLLAETEYRKAIEATIEPFKGLLLGIFFFTVGMNVDVRELARQPLLLLACVTGLILVKAAITAALARWYELSRPAAAETGLLLGPGGEFAFVGLGLASAAGLVDGPTSRFLLAVTSLSMALIPALSYAAGRLTDYMQPAKAPDPELAVEPLPQSRHAIVVGYGRVGQVVCDLLADNGIGYIAVDQDPRAVVANRERGAPVFYGNAANPEFLKTCGIATANGVIITVHSREAIDAVVATVRTLRPDILIVSRARDAAHARHLYARGVSDAVPETIEASLQLSEAALVGLGVATGAAIATIHEKRDVFRADLQQAARQAGVADTRGVRAKST